MTTPANIPAECDYLVIGGGATALAFCDSLLQGLVVVAKKKGPSSSVRLPSIVVLDPHNQPGGQWNDSYEFVQLHQPSSMYGVESLALQPTSRSSDDAASTTQHRATRNEILAYYRQVLQKWQGQITFLGSSMFDFSSLHKSLNESTTKMDASAVPMINRYQHSGVSREMRVRAKVVDARYLQPDLPIDTPPKFGFDATQITCIPVNALTEIKATKPNDKFVVVGGGKTGMDAVYFLLTQRQVAADKIVWVVPHDAWITARESIGNCLEFLHTVLKSAQTQQQQQQHGGDLSKYVQTSPDCLQQAFLQWEKRGKVYRLDPDILPTKFKDATLSKEELTTLRTLSNVVRGRGRITKITNDGDLQFQDGSVYVLPWQGESQEASNSTTTFVHCSAGAFNYTKQSGGRLPIFSDHLLTIQDVYGTPGFCFVGSIMGKLESLSNVLSNAQKNALLLAPSPSDDDAPPPPLGPSGGDIGTLSPAHGFVQRLVNVRQWLQVPELRDWLVGHRLFNLGHYTNADAIQAMVDETWSIALQSGLIEENSRNQ